VNEALARWNQLRVAEAENQIMACCGSPAWARGMVSRRPLGDEAALLVASDETWRGLSEADWKEAFRRHPRIGESRAEQPVEGRSSAWSAEEQSGLTAGDEAIKIALADANREYEKRFGYIFIVCASGKSAAEILAILRQRLHHDGMTELREAAEQQRQITEIRLKKWLAG
jgi:2-oxo-4-hydroxy-4-carboxy-5-ureidoimidazoline decarboxylase